MSNAASRAAPPGSYVANHAAGTLAASTCPAAIQPAQVMPKLRAMLANCQPSGGRSLSGALLVGFASALRRGELTALNDSLCQNGPRLR